MAYKYLNDDGLKAYTKKVKGALKDLHTPIAISSENTTESIAQNVRNIADFVAKAKAAGIADVNGMMVTCLIDNNYSGVGYLYGDNYIQGVLIKDDLIDNMCFTVTSIGAYNEISIITSYSSGEVTSGMLDQGARKPIILTPETTEVDEKTYQKLISDDVDVMLKANDGEYCALTYKSNSDTARIFYFTCLSTEGVDMGSMYIYAYEVSIAMTSPHTCTITPLYEAQTLDGLIETEFVHKGNLSPVLQEIDLTGTDAQRKAKLDKFEADWKALTGASNLTGARFVGTIQYEHNYEYTGIFVWNETSVGYYAIIGGGTDGGSYSQPLVVFVMPDNGYCGITPLLFNKPIAIKAGNTAADIAANKTVIKAHRENLAKLGFYQDGYQVSVIVTSDGEEYTGTLSKGTGLILNGIVTDANETHHYPFHIDTKTGIVTFDKTNYFLEKTSNEVTEMLDAIKYSYTPVPLTATISTNKTQLDLFLSKVPNAQVMHCTYKNVYAGTLHKIGTDWFGQLVKNTNSYEDCICIKLVADGTVTEGTTSLQVVNAKLDNIIG